VIRLAALLGTIIISFSAIFVRLADVAPATAGLFRVVYAFPVLVMLALRANDDRPMRMRLLALASGLLLAGDIALWHTSIELIGAGLATVLANTQVLWVGAAAWLLFGERPTRTTFVVVPIVLTGVALIGGVGSSDAFGDNPALGALLGLGAGLFYAGFLLIFRTANTAGQSSAGPLLDVTIGIMVAFLAGGWLDPGFSIEPMWPAHGWLIALGVLVHTGGWLLIASALPRLPSLETSVMLLLQPAGTILWASLIFTERLAGAQWFGVALVLGGIVLAATRGTVTPPATQTPTDP
jgi:drug/metabolite transporter (DMT)-like permease